MEKGHLITYVDGALKDLCSHNPQYHIFRIGSSLFHNQIPIHDIDYLLINESSTFDFTDQIVRLKKEFSGENFLKAAISTYDEFLDKEFNKLEMSLHELFQQRAIHAFGFGPIPMPQDENILILHLAGPMNVKSINVFFEQFPLFYPPWSKFHLQLGTKDFNTLINDPGFNSDDIREEQQRIYKRAKTIDSLKIKRQCLKRLKLVELSLENHHNPYVESYNQTSNKTYEEIIAELEKYNS